jgi:hypothetical protein
LTVPYRRTNWRRFKKSSTFLPFYQEGLNQETIQKGIVMSVRPHRIGIKKLHQPWNKVRENTTMK